MKRLVIQIPEDLHDSLESLARRRKVSVSHLAQEAIEASIEDIADGQLISQERAAHLADPESSLTLDEFLDRYRDGIHGSDPAASGENP